MTPRGRSEGGECSLQTAESASGAVSTWRLKPELMGCMLSRLQEVVSTSVSDKLQSVERGKQSKQGLDA